MSTVGAKPNRSLKSHDKQNLPHHSNNINQSHQAPKEPLKTGVEIRNKLKANNAFKPPLPSAKKQQIRKNSHILEKVHKKIFEQKGRPAKNNPNDDCNLSSSSSVRSLKSVTFSIDHSIDSNQSLSHSNLSTGGRQKSILKNKLMKERQPSSSEVNDNVKQKQSLTSSHCSHMKNSEQAVESLGSNHIVMQKYERLQKQLKVNRQKYTDSIYPPCESSIFLKSIYTKQFLEKLNNEGYKIKWMRLTDIYTQKQQCLWHSEQKSTVTKGFIHSSNKQHNYMSTVLNSINKSYLMEKFFENQSLSPEGIYFVKMHQTQTNQWKYVIVDDFVPVVVSNKNGESGKVIKPAFLDVYSEGSVVELWPFLVQKAFAKYYSTYDSLIKGNTLDFLEQITGNYFTTLSTNSFEDDSQTDNQIKLKISKLIKNPYNIILAETKDGMIYPVNASPCSEYKIFDIQDNYRLQKIDQQHFENYFMQIHVIQAKKYSNQINCFIKQEHLLEKQKQLHQNRKPFILRSFTLKQSTTCTLALTQKEQRFHRNSKSYKIKQNYTYSWIRMILVMKESTGYRWVDSVYEKKKIIKIQADLEPGQYFAVILPEWAIKPYDLKLSLFSNSSTTIERKSYENHLRIIEESCMDLAQRFGKLTQINANICSYNYIDYKVGFIIENINNEKNSGQVKILRTIDGLETYNITPVNIEFQKKSKLQIRIPSLQSFTVVLKVSGGVDRSFLEQFDFGI